MDDETARALVLDAADRLFYEHGIRAVGMDQVRDDSGVSLKRLYKMFPAKEHLAEAVLRRRDQSFQRALAEHVATLPDPRARLLSVFDFLYDNDGITARPLTETATDYFGSGIGQVYSRSGWDTQATWINLTGGPK